VTLPLALDAYTTEWLNLLVRGLHVVAGIAWIGSSFYFIALDLKLGRPAGEDAERRGVGGEAWEVHGGGFYHVQKYRVAPPVLPERLLWFKWEAYATWLSGFALLVVLYYANADAYLIDPGVADVSTGIAIGASVAILVAGWLAYDLLCRTLARSDAALALAVVAGTIGLAYGAGELFSARGAYIQVGATLGTLMAGNVLFVIIPGHWELVRAKRAGREPDPVHGIRGKQRSVHNNYLTLPVVFVMLSGHYPLAYATRWSWVIFALLLVMGGTIRHFFNLRHQGKPSPWWTWGAAAACALVIVWLSTLGPAGAAVPRGAKGAEAATAPVTFQQVEEIVISRCSMCHAADPVWRGIIRPPHGVVLDTPERIKMHARDIALAAVWSNAMPPSNVTSMTPEERQMLATWLSSRRPPK
jgi:uncharacterized membrane protein